MISRLERRLMAVLAGALGLLILAASLNPLLASPKDPPGSRIPAGAVSFADTPPDALTLAVVKQAVARTQLAAVRATAITPPPAPVRPAAAPVAPSAPAPAPSASAPVAAPPAVAPPAAGTNWAASAFGACVRSRENGGSYAWGTGNGGGAYQFLASTWYGNGAAAGTYGNASAAYQDMIFNKTVAADGDAPWRSYDGCVL